MASPIACGLAAAILSLSAGAALACPDLAACGGMSRHYGYYTEQASFGPLADSAYGPQGYEGDGQGDYDQGGYGYDQGGSQDQGPDYGPDQGGPEASGPPPYDPRYDEGAAVYEPQQGYGSQAYGSQGYAAQRHGASSSSSTRSSVSESSYDSGWRRVPGSAPAGYGDHSYGAVSVERYGYDSGWRERRGRTEVLCPPGSAFARPDPRHGCPVAQGYGEARLPTSFFADSGGVGPEFIAGGGGGGGMVIVGGGARAGAVAFASARASASVHVGGHGGGHGHGCGCGGHGRH